MQILTVAFLENDIMTTHCSNHDDLDTRFCPKCGCENPACTLHGLIDALEKFEKTSVIKITAVYASAWRENMQELLNQPTVRGYP